MEMNQNHMQHPPIIVKKVASLLLYTRSLNMLPSDRSD
jgi:hypothetical protein